MILAERIARICKSRDGDVYIGRSLMARIWFADEWDDVAIVEQTFFNVKKHAEQLIDDFGKSDAADVWRTIARAIMDLDQHINAVEVIDQMGEGTVLYRDWP